MVSTIFGNFDQVGHNTFGLLVDIRMAFDESDQEPIGIGPHFSVRTEFKELVNSG